ncbi:MAG TPA: hypothetical protein VN648_33830, partial [Candidatus Methylomirabilis sp.]|nr:hypothetical protein [Candidatus Methylomirabilis sp.]
HTSLLATLRKTWGLGDAFTERDASSRTFEHAFSLTTPRDPTTWAPIKASPVPEWTMDPKLVGKGLSAMGEGLGEGLIAKARELKIELPFELSDPDAKLTPDLIVKFLRDIAHHFFPAL